MKSMLIVISATIIILSSNLAIAEQIGVSDMPNTVAPGQRFNITYINLDEGKRVIVEFYPILTQLLPYQYSADEYHGKKYGNISRLITISLEMSSAWSVTPKKINLANAGNQFTITVILKSTGYWDILLLLKYENGSVDYVIHSLPYVAGEEDIMGIVMYIAIYIVSIFTGVFIVFPLWKQRKLKSLEM